MYPFNDIRQDTALYTRELQQYLRYLSQYYTSIPRVNIDGVYGKRTGDAVSMVQRRFGLPITRNTDRVTWETIQKEYERLYRRQPEEDWLAAVLPLRENDSGQAIYQLRSWLHTLGNRYANLPAVTPGDVYTPETTGAVAQMQQILLLPINGITNLATWQGISRAAQIPLV